MFFVNRNTFRRVCLRSYRYRVESFVIAGVVFFIHCVRGVYYDNGYGGGFRFEFLKMNIATRLARKIVSRPSARYSSIEFLQSVRTFLAREPNSK
jgi:hypothetical protein